ncbi:MAG: hypothetical protein DRJ52_06895 [Thermoprotei archaeon]|nr:MAG: hypothetical protein DRJ52_06895 [Thermoprotei archaeon]RLF00654.1 MAG: hypothetical protein DRJ63_01820 [Thermoprotei archaeon]
MIGIEHFLFQVSVGGLLGFATGYAVKKIAKLAILVLGIFTAILLYLEYSGVITINYAKLTEIMYNMWQVVSAKAQGMQSYVASHIPFAASFIPGFIIGFKKG